MIRKTQLVGALLFLVARAAIASPAVQISSTPLPTGKVSVGYRTSLSATGGTAPYRWKLATGSLPSGLVLSEATGAIVGVPQQAETATLGMEVTDASGTTASATLILNVTAADWGTAYYVDGIAGNDSNAGTSEDAAWKTLGRVNQASFAPGDVILLKRGGLWREQLNLSVSGLLGSPILVDAYGSGNAPIVSGADLLPVAVWESCSACQAYVWTTVVKTQPNVVLFNGILGNQRTSLAALASATDWFWTNGVLYVWFTGNPGYSYRSPGVEVGSRSFGIGFFAASYITVQNLQVTAANGKPSNGAVYAQQSTQLGKSAHDITLVHLTVTNGAGDGIHLEDCQGCIVEDAAVSGMFRNGIELVAAHANFPVTAAAVLGSTVAQNGYDGIGTYGCAMGASCEGIVEPTGLFFSGVIVANNTVHDNGSGIYFRWTNHSSILANSTYHNVNSSLHGELEGIELEASSDNTVERNLIYTNTMSGLELSNDRGAGSIVTGSTGNVVAYNAIHDNGQHGLFTNAAPTANNIFRYNVVWNHTSGECFLADGAGHQFYGNTCSNNSTGIDLYTSSTTPTTASITLKNNVIAGSLHQAVKIETGVTMASLTFDHNDYYSASGATLFAWPGAIGDLALWQSRFAYDVHSMIANPQFASAAPTEARGLAVSSSSPVVGAGQTLDAPNKMGLNAQSLWPTTVELIQQNTAWDIGAFMAQP